jgi:hypothetical protein
MLSLAGLKVWLSRWRRPLLLSDYWDARAMPVSGASLMPSSLMVIATVSAAGLQLIAAVTQLFADFANFVAALSAFFPAGLLVFAAIVLVRRTRSPSTVVQAADSRGAWNYVHPQTERTIAKFAVPALGFLTWHAMETRVPWPLLHDLELTGFACKDDGEPLEDCAIQAVTAARTASAVTSTDSYGYFRMHLPRGTPRPIALSVQPEAEAPRIARLESGTPPDGGGCSPNPLGQGVYWKAKKKWTFAK